MSKWKHRPKGQQAVSKDYKHKDNQPRRLKYIQDIREYHQKAKSTAYGHSINSPKRVWEHILYGGRDFDYFSNALTQTERNIFRMYPTGGSWAIGGNSYYGNDWVSTQGNSFILEKRSKRRCHCFKENEWKDMVDYIRKKKAGIYTIIFCRRKLTDEIWEANNKEYIEKYGKDGFNTRNFDKVFVNGFSREELERIYYPKLYEKEKQYIINAGCTFEGNIEFNIIRAPRYNGDSERIFVMEGWKFRINRTPEEINEMAEDEFNQKRAAIKASKKKSFIKKIKNMCSF